MGSAQNFSKSQANSFVSNIGGGIIITSQANSQNLLNDQNIAKTNKNSQSDTNNSIKIGIHT